MPYPAEQREVCYDRDLLIEAYRLSGIAQSFPAHFHEYYVIGFLKGGRRRMWCRNEEWDLAAGDLVLLEPRESHRCAPLGGEPLHYLAVNIPLKAMEKSVQEVTGRSELPRFSRCTARDPDTGQALQALCQTVMTKAPVLEREEAFCLLLEQVFHAYTLPNMPEREVPAVPIQALCGYIETHYTESITLDQLAAMTPFGKSYMIRSFTRQVGVSPYRYLQTIRMNQARALLERGYAPADAAVMAGFADQSHFSRFFKSFTGLTPGQYQRIFPHGLKGT